MKRCGLPLTVFLLFACIVLADEGQHHEDLRPEQLGTVHFPSLLRGCGAEAV